MEAESLLRQAGGYVSGGFPADCAFISASLGLITLLR